MVVRKKRWSDEEFLKKHKEVLKEWPTGKEVDLDEAIAYNKSRPGKNYANRLKKAGRGALLVQINCGWPLPEQMIESMQAMEQAGVDIINIETDTYGRRCRFDDAQRGIDGSRETGKPMLNGYPVVNYGVKKTRKVIESTSIPIIQNVFDETPFLMAEVGLASGICNGVVGGGCYDLNVHSRNYPLEKKIEGFQYVCKLGAYYTERGVPIIMLNPGTIVPYIIPSLGIACNVLGTLVAAEQGVKHVISSSELTGSLVQDVAAIDVSRSVIDSYLRKFGYNDVNNWIMAYTWTGDWPKDESVAAATISWLVAEAVLGETDVMICKTIQEAVGVPDVAAKVKTAKMVRQAIRMVKNQRLPESKERKEERDMMEAEVRAIVDKVIDLGDGDPIAGQVKAVEMGVIDSPFSPWVHLKGQVLPIRDSTGATRYLDHGNLPFNDEILDYHRRKIAEREKAEHRKADVEMVIEDLRFMSGLLS